MIYLQKMYQMSLFRGKYKHIFKSLMGFCLLRLLNLSICHTFYYSPLMASKGLSWDEFALLIHRAEGVS